MLANGGLPPLLLPVFRLSRCSRGSKCCYQRGEADDVNVDPARGTKPGAPLLARHFVYWTEIYEELLLVWAAGVMVRQQPRGAAHHARHNDRSGAPCAPFRFLD